MKEQKIVIVNNKGQKLAGHYYKNTSGILLIYCHGSESFGPYFDQMQYAFEAYYSLGLSLFWFDFTGFGDSEGTGKYNHSQRVSDIGNVLNHFKRKYKKIILAGVSMGSIATAIAAIQYKEITKLYLINGFYAMRYVSPQFIFPLVIEVLFNSEARRELFYGWKNLKPEKIKIPTLIVVGKKDEIVNPKQSISFYKRLKSKKKLVVIPDGDHGLLDKKYIKLYFPIIGKWLKE